MPGQAWDENGNPVGAAPKQSWDETGKPVQGMGGAGGSWDAAPSPPLFQRLHNLVTPSPLNEPEQAGVEARPGSPLNLQGKGNLGKAQASLYGLQDTMQRQDLEGAMRTHKGAGTLRQLSEAGVGMGADITGLAGQAAEHPIATAAGIFSKGITAIPTAAYFIYQGIKGGLPEQQAHETSEDFLQRRLLSASMIAGATAMELHGAQAAPEAVKGIVDNYRAIKRIQSDQMSVNTGQTQVMQNMVKPALTLLKHKMDVEIGSSVDHVLARDTLDATANGIQPQTTVNASPLPPPGRVNLTNAANDAIKVINNTSRIPGNPVYDLINEAQRSSATSLGYAKSLATQAWEVANRLSNAGHAQDAMTAQALARGISEAGQDRANALGLGDDWRHYKNETRAYKELQTDPDTGKPRLLGKLQSTGRASDFLDHIIDSGNEFDLRDIKKMMKTYNIDSTPLDKAVEIAKPLAESTKSNGNLFYGKIKAVIKYPWLAGPALAGASYAAEKAGVGGALGRMIIPLIIAGKVAGLLDNIKIAKILDELDRTVGPAQVGRQAQGPTPRTQNFSPLQGQRGFPTQPAGTPPTQGGAGAAAVPPSHAAGNMPAQPRSSAVATGDASLLSNPTVMKALVERLVDARMSRGIQDSYTKAQEGMGANPKGKPRE